MEVYIEKSLTVDIDLIKGLRWELEGVQKELKARDLKDVSSEKLLNMIKDLEEKFKEEIKNITCHSEETEENSGFGRFGNLAKYYWNLED